MKIIAVIPARYNSKRFPGKLLKKIGKRTIIELLQILEVILIKHKEVWENLVLLIFYLSEFAPLD